MKRSMMIFALSLLLLAAAVMSASAQEMMAKPDMMMSDDKRPVVVFVRADWCPYCKELEPKMSKLVEQYGDKLKFVTLDITNKAATEKSAVLAKEAGLSEFFEMNKTKASTMVIFKDKTKIFTLYHSSDEKEVAAAFEKAIKE
jgi:thiol-disulfide isomerase/thioredoxin